MQGMSQEKLGSALGLTFQWVQKYEKRTNRIGAKHPTNAGIPRGFPRTSRRTAVVGPWLTPPAPASDGSAY
jgi:hypothetical protein